MGSSEATTLVEGRARGEVLKLSEPLNLWGGLDPFTGEITHRSHPQRGESIANKIVVLRETRGSGTNAQLFAQALAGDGAPRGVIVAARDYVLAAGAAAGIELYGATCPVVLVDEACYAELVTGMTVEIDADEDGARLTVS